MRKAISLLLAFLVLAQPVFASPALFNAVPAFTPTLTIQNLPQSKNTFREKSLSHPVTYDKVGNRISKTMTTGAENYGYDKTYRLTEVKKDAAVVENYSYDKVGNRVVSKEHNDWTYNNLNQLTAYNGFTFTYDNNGNTLTKTGGAATTNYSWDYENHLVGVTSGAMTASYAYDLFGKRINKITNGINTNYVYDNEDIIGEYDSAGNLIAKYIYGATRDEPIMRIDKNSNRYFYCFDGLGSVSNVLDNAGQILKTYRYDLFGKSPDLNDNAGGLYGYTARQFDSETGLYYYRNRYYDSVVGRFLSPDPIADDVLLSPYVYCRNNPANWVDPSGLMPICHKTSEWRRLEQISDLHGGKLLAHWIEFYYETVGVGENFPEYCTCKQRWTGGKEFWTYLDYYLMEADFSCHDSECPQKTWTTTKQKKEEEIRTFSQDVTSMGGSGIFFERGSAASQCTCDTRVYGTGVKRVTK